VQNEIKTVEEKLKTLAKTWSFEFRQISRILQTAGAKICKNHAFEKTFSVTSCHVTIFQAMLAGAFYVHLDCT